jgi:hypothetical protein
MEKIKGYWTGKKKDQKTIDALNISKFKKCFLYNKEGKLVKIYDSYKECSNDLIGDYKIIEGSGQTILYQIINRRLLKNKIIGENFIFNESFLNKFYDKIPNNIDIEFIFKKTNKERKYPKNIIKKQYQVISEYNNEIKTFKNVKECSKYYNISENSIRRRINGKVKDIYKFRYGVKI